MTEPAIHLVALPHAQTTDDVTVCAFTQQIVRFCRMMAPTRELYLYSGDRNDAPCTEHIACYSSKEQKIWYPGISADTLPEATFDPHSEPWVTMNARAVMHIAKRASKKDIVLLSGGLAQQLIALGLPNQIVAEYAIGYEGCFAERRAYVSQAWRHYIHGKYTGDVGRWDDAVIPYFFDPAEWGPVTDAKTDDLLFIGRLIHRKGPHIAAEIARATGRKLLVAGPGATSHGSGFVVGSDGTRIEGDVEYLGVLNHAERAQAMARASAVLVPTLYFEPFGAVAVEAQLCGTPAITTNWGAFPETVGAHYRFDNLSGAVAAVEVASDTGRSKKERERLRTQALDQFGFGRVGPMYDAWLARLGNLWGEGWYAR